MKIVSKYYVWLGFCLVLGLAIFISFYCFRTHPDFWFDEGIFYQIIKNWAVNGQAELPLSPTSSSDLSIISMGYSVFWPAVLAFKIFGPGVGVIRTVAILFLLGVLVAVFFLAKRLYGPRIALGTMLLLATFSPLYGNGKSFLGEVPGLFYLLIALILLTIVERSKSKQIIVALLSGGFFGLAVSAKPLFILVLPALIIALVLRRRYFFYSAPGRISVIAGAGGLILAFGYWLFSQFGQNTSISGVLTHYSNPYYLDSFWPVIKTNIFRFFSETTPAFFLIQILLSGYYFFSIRRRRGNILASEIATFSFSVLVAAAYLRTTGWYRNFFPGHIAIFLFTLPGIKALVNDLPVMRKNSHFFMATGFVIFFIVQLLPLSKNTLSCTMDAATKVEPYLRMLNKNEPILFYNLPQLAARFSGNNVFQYIKMSDTLQLGQDNLVKLKEDFFSKIVIESNNQTGIAGLPECFQLEETIWPIQIHYRNKDITCQSE